MNRCAFVIGFVSLSFVLMACAAGGREFKSGLEHFQKGNYERALEEIEKAEKLSPANADYKAKKIEIQRMMYANAVKEAEALSKEDLVGRKRALEKAPSPADKGSIPYERQMQDTKLQEVKSELDAVKSAVDAVALLEENGDHFAAFQNGTIRLTKHWPCTILSMDKPSLILCLPRKEHMPCQKIPRRRRHYLLLRLHRLRSATQR